jgi:hypothetical protein
VTTAVDILSGVNIQILSPRTALLSWINNECVDAAPISLISGATLGTVSSRCTGSPTDSLSYIAGMTGEPSGAVVIANNVFVHVIERFSAAGILLWSKQINNWSPVGNGLPDQFSVSRSSFVLSGIGRGQIFRRFATSGGRGTGIFSLLISPVDGKVKKLSLAKGNFSSHGSKNLELVPIGAGFSNGHAEVLYEVLGSANGDRWVNVPALILGVSNTTAR